LIAPLHDVASDYYGYRIFAKAARANLLKACFHLQERCFDPMIRRGCEKYRQNEGDRRYYPALVISAKG
jgi:hypothetical protein